MGRAVNTYIHMLTTKYFTSSVAFCFCWLFLACWLYFCHVPLLLETTSVFAINRTFELPRFPAITELYKSYWIFVCFLVVKEKCVNWPHSKSRSIQWCYQHTHTIWIICSHLLILNLLRIIFCCWSITWYCCYHRLSSLPLYN